jgi:hypothetical protein
LRFYGHFTITPVHHNAWTITPIAVNFGEPFGEPRGGVKWGQGWREVTVG